jgi:hypothetical protein
MAITTATITNQPMKNLHSLTNSLVKEIACRDRYPIKPVRKGSNQILYRILEAKATIQFISYLPKTKVGKRFAGYPKTDR